MSVKRLFRRCVNNHSSDKPLGFKHLRIGGLPVTPDLIEYLEHYRDELGGDAEVRLMTQQNWPMVYAICGLASQDEMDERIERDGGNAEVTDETEGDDEPVLFIVEGRQLGYGSRRAWDVAG